MTRQKAEVTATPSARKSQAVNFEKDASQAQAQQRSDCAYHPVPSKTKSSR